MKRAKESPALQSTDPADSLIPAHCNQNGIQIQLVSQNVNILNSAHKGIKTDKSADHSTAVSRIAAPNVTVEAGDQKSVSEKSNNHSIKRTGFFKVSEFSAFDPVPRKGIASTEANAEALTFK